MNSVWLDLPPLDSWAIQVIGIYGSVTAALALWLTVRIINRRERWAKWTLAGVVGPPLLYILSIGPACWWFGSESPNRLFGCFEIGCNYAPHIYWPVGQLLWYSPTPVRKGVCFYAQGWREPVMIPIDSAESGHVGFP